MSLGQKMSSCISATAKDMVVAAEATTAFAIWRVLYDAFGEHTEVQQQKLFERLKNETFSQYCKQNPHLTGKNSTGNLIKLWANSLNSRLGKLKLYLPTDGSRGLFVRDRLLNGLTASFQPLITNIRAGGNNETWKQLTDKLSDWAESSSGETKQETSGGNGSNSAPSTSSSSSATNVMFTQKEVEQMTKKAVNDAKSTFFATKGKNGKKGKGKKGKGKWGGNKKKNGGHNNNNDWGSNDWNSGGPQYNDNDWSQASSSSSSGPYSGAPKGEYTLQCAHCHGYGHSSAYCYQKKGDKKGGGKGKPVWKK
jgi:hypothetical protein